MSIIAPTISKRCIDCHTEVSSTKRFRYLTGEYRCLRCYDAVHNAPKHFARCADCSTSLTADQTLFHNGETVCAHCMNCRTSTVSIPTEVCEHCQKQVPMSDVLTLKNKERICKPCNTQYSRLLATRVKKLSAMSSIGTVARYR